MTILRQPLPESVEKIVRYWTEFDFVIDKVGPNKTLVIEVDLDLSATETIYMANFLDCMDAWAKAYVKRNQDYMIKTCRIVPVGYGARAPAESAMPTISSPVEGLGSM